jgi:hypothetical protein
MAKRIKVKGKTPRGLSKAQRRVINPLESKRAALISYDRNLARAGAPEGVDPELVERLDYMIEDALERRAGDISSIPSSTRKKLAKEGNRKFIGPRQLKSELAEDLKARGGLRSRLKNLDLDPLVTAGDSRSLNYGKLRDALRNYLIKTGKIPPF